MMPDIDIIERQRDIVRYVFPIREKVFIGEFGYPYEDNQVICEIDALSNHYVWLLDGEPARVVSVADLSGIDFLLNQWGIDPNLHVAKPHKFAVPEPLRGLVDVRTLLEFMKDELANYDYVTAHVSRPSNQPSFTHHLDMARKYETYFGLKPIASARKNSGADMLVLGRTI